MKLRYAAPALLFALIFSIDATAQYRPNIVFWDSDQNCGSKKLVDSRGRVRCRWQRFGKEKILTIEVPGMEVSVFAVSLSKTLPLYVKVENKGGTTISVEPTDWSVASYSSEEAFRSGASPTLHETSIPARDTSAQKNNSKATSAPQIQPLDPQISTKQIDSIGSAESPSTPMRIPEHRQTTVVVNDNANVGNPSGSVAAVSGISLFRHFGRTRLVSKELLKGDSASGVVYFNVSQESPFQVVILHLGEYSFVFIVSQRS